MKNHIYSWKLIYPYLSSKNADVPQEDNPLEMVI